MKRKLADRTQWSRILERRFFAGYRESEEFTGYVTLLTLDKVREPLWVDCGGTNVCIVDTGYSWLQQFPIGAYYAVTTAFDADGKVVQWYIDICKQHAVTEEGIPWYDDLYLDIALLPTGEMMILDEEELEEALQDGTVSQADYELAWHETNRLLKLIEQDAFTLLKLGEAHREWLLQSA